MEYMWYHRQYPLVRSQLTVSQYLLHNIIQGHLFLLRHHQTPTVTSKSGVTCIECVFFALTVLFYVFNSIQITASPILIKYELRIPPCHHELSRWTWMWLLDHMLVVL